MSPRRFPLWPALLVLWAALFLPTAVERPLFLEEGRRALAAQAALDGGHWLRQEVVGEGYFNKPPLLPVLIAAVSWASGGVAEWTVRLPGLLATLATALIAFALARRSGGDVAGLAAGAAFLLAPLILEKAAVAETDTIITAACFAAFAVWWGGERKRDVRPARWLACAGLLALGALAKGPVGVAFFAAGVGGYLAWQRRWAALAWLAATLLLALAPLGAWALAVAEPGSGALWRREMRLVSDELGVYLAALPRSAAQLIVAHLPWLLAAAPAWVPRWRRALAIDGALAAALLFYAVGFLFVLVFWPGSRARYGMPAVPAVATAAGLVVAALWTRTVWVRVGIPATALCLVVVHALTTSGLGPWRRQMPTALRAAGEQMASAVAADPAPVYALDSDIDYNLVFYTDQRVQSLAATALPSLTSPAWLIAPAWAVDGLRASSRGLAATSAVDASLPNGARYLLLRFTPEG